MALPNSNISVSMVKSELGASTNDVGQLCIHPNVNKWSKWKPVRHSSKNPLTEEQLISVGCGLRRNNINEIIYDKPRGGISPYDEPYRLSDFKSYNHHAIPPVYPEIIEVKDRFGTTVPGPVWTLVEGMRYTIYFKLLAGEIDPSWIDPQTNRIKNTNPSGGYGGVTWISEYSGPTSVVEYDVHPDDVFSVILESPSEQTIHTQTIDGGGNPRMEYVRYKGSTINMYNTFNKYIEDDYELETSYRRKLATRPLSARISNETPFTLQRLTSDVSLRMMLVNDELFNVDVKIEVKYKRLETGLEYTYTDATARELSPGSQIIFIQPITGWATGLNTYEIRVWMYLVRPNLPDKEISFRMDTASITIASEG
jgi:hypothetical protein